MSPRSTTPAATSSGDIGGLLQPYLGFKGAAPLSEEEQRQTGRQRHVDQRENEEEEDNTFARRGRLTYPHQMIDDPRLAAELGYEPPRLDGDEAQGRRRRQRQQQEPPRLDTPPFPRLPPEP